MIIDNFSINYVSICYCCKQTFTSMTPYDRGKTHNIIFLLSLILTTAINFPHLHKKITTQQSSWTSLWSTPPRFSSLSAISLLWSWSNRSFKSLSASTNNAATFCEDNRQWSKAPYIQYIDNKKESFDHGKNKWEVILFNWQKFCHFLAKFFRLTDLVKTSVYNLHKKAT